ncbi:MAG: tetratricopeptide repeat protein [Terriglobales bacterium]|jgi:predicted Zn-dependent protease
MDRAAVLKQVLEQNPDDAFARYGLAMEFSRAGDVEAALQEFNTLIAKQPTYIAAYHMAGQMLAGADRTNDACDYLKNGIAMAQTVGNSHARAEMEALLDDISRT